VLVRRFHDTYRGDVDAVHVHMTPAGRKLAREASGEVREKKLPAGTLRKWHWRALAQMYRSGGIHTVDWSGDYYALDDNAHDWHNRVKDETIRRLEEYKWGALCRVVFGSAGAFGEACIDLTPFGRQYYEREWARYRELYPDVDAPEPVSSSR
jgi:hypothetical protein